MTIHDTEFTFTFTGLFGSPFFTGASSVSADVPDKWHIALDGHTFMLDEPPLWRTIPTMRAQQDDREAAELSLNPEGLWRRSQSSWELGAGQVMYDDENSQRQRFRTSKGLDVWTPGQVALLPATTLLDAVSPSASYVQVETTDAHLWWCDGATVVRSDLASQLDITGTPPGAITAMVSTGSHVLVGYTGGGIYKIAAGASSASPWLTDAITPSVVGWAKGRVIVAVGNTIYNPVTAFTTSGTLPIPLLQHPDTSFRWVGVAEGTSWIFMGGVSGDKSSIYRTVVRPDGTSLDVPTVCGRLPDGEVLTAVHGYLGVLLLGTTLGVRVATPNGNGDLVIGSLMEIGRRVESMAGWGTFVYFGWSNYDTTSTGVGRIDLSNLTDEDNLVPAYASDLMATAQGSVLGIGVLHGTVVFGVNGVGAYRASDTELVLSGTYDTGIIRYGITEEKVVTGARASFTGPGTTGVALAVGGGEFASVGATGMQERGINYEMRVTLNQDGSHTNVTLESVTLFSYPAPQGTKFIDLPLLIAEKVLTLNSIVERMDIKDTLDFINDRWLTKVLVTLQLGSTNFQGTIEQYQFKATNECEDEDQRGQWNGTAPVSFKVVS